MPSRTPRLRPRLTALAGAALLLFASGAASQESGGQRIAAVTLSSGSLVEIRWSARVLGSAELRLAELAERLCETEGELDRLQSELADFVGDL